LELLVSRDLRNCKRHSKRQSALSSLAADGGDDKRPNIAWAVPQRAAAECAALLGCRCRQRRRHDLLCLLLDLRQMRLILEAFCVDLVDVFRA
jgi:hypothetical protein